MKNWPPLLFACFLFFSVQNLKNEAPKNEVEAAEQTAQSDWFFEQRAFPLGFIPLDARLEAMRQADFFKKNAAERGGPTWQFAGPTNLTGRISCLAVHPTEPLTVFCGSASGGIWKSKDGGSSWLPIFDDQPSLSIGDVAVSFSNKNILYAGTGESNGGGGSLTYDGLGIFKTTDAGQNWQFAGLQNIGNVGRVAIDPTNPDRVFVAGMGNLFANDSDRGIYRTLDGGSNWQKVLFVSDSTGGIDVAIKPTDPQTIVAAMWQRVRRPSFRQYGGPTSGVFRSKDGGDTWQKLTNGLPTAQVGRIGLAFAPSKPQTIYALIASENGSLLGIYRSQNGGDSWGLQFQSGMPGQFYGQQGWWYGNIWVDPTDENHLFTGGIELFESHDGGASWSLNASAGVVHADHHAMWIDPADPHHIYNGNDGGFYRTTDGQNWEETFELPITQFYRTTIDFQNPEIVYGGAQDNGTWRTIDGSQPEMWEQIFGGDGFVPLVDPTDNHFVYCEYQYGALGRSDDGGFSFNDISGGIGAARANWNTPVVFHPNDPMQLFFGGESLWHSFDRGDSWEQISPDLTDGMPSFVPFGTITTIAVSSVNLSKTIWCGTDDGHVWVTQNGGSDWQNVSANLPSRWVTRLVASPQNEATAYATISGFRWFDALPHVFKTTDFGQTWQPISSNLPEAPVSDLVIDPQDAATLWVATDFGVFVSHDDGGSWNLLAAGLPNAPVLNLAFHAPTRKLIAATYGRSMYSLDLQTVSSSEPLGAVRSLRVFPNPISEKSTAQFFLSEKTVGSVELFDLAGKRLKTIAQKTFEAGKNEVGFSKNDLPTAGVFLLVVRAAGGVISQKIMCFQ